MMEIHDVPLLKRFDIYNNIRHMHDAEMSFVDIVELLCIVYGNEYMIVFRTGVRMVNKGLIDYETYS